MSELIAVDTETTGLDLRHGCKPFMLSTCTPEGQVNVWEWPVCPTTRQPIIPHQDKIKIAEYLKGKTLVFHNAKFDLRALSTIGFRIFFYADKFDVPAVVSKGYGLVRIYAHTYHDTLFASHACSSADKHGLKDLAVKYLRFSDSDETHLKELVDKAARYCRSHDLDVSFGESPVGKRQTAYDYWLPKYVAGKMFEELEEIDSEIHNFSLKKDKNSRELKRLEKLYAQAEELEDLMGDMNDCCARYAGKDVERTILLWQFYNDSGIMDDLNVRKGYERERVLMQSVYKMESGGITVNQKQMKRKATSLTKKMDSYAIPATQFASKYLGREANVNSDDQIRELLFTELKIEPRGTTGKGKPSADKKSLEKILEHVSHPDSPDYDAETTKFLENLMLSRSYKKALEGLSTYSKYAQSLKARGTDGCAVLYPSLNQTGSNGDMATTRFSSSNPNGQNVSKIAEIKIGRAEFPGPRIRDVFAPLPGKIWYDIDYNQLELRIFAYCSQEQSLIKALAEGHDFHEFVACRIFGKAPDQISKQERRIAKNTNFAIIFGASPYKVDLTAGMHGAYEMFAGQFPNVGPYMQETIAKVGETGYVLTLDDYRLDVPRNEPYKGVSYKVQGTAGSIIKNAMIEIDRRELVDWKHSRLALQVHDELIAEFTKSHSSHKPATVFKIMDAMEQAGADLGILTPVSCDRIETDWGHGEPVIVTSRRIKPAPSKAA